MGYIRHHAIIVTSWDTDRIKEAHAKAVEMFSHTRLAALRVSPLLLSPTNEYTTFLIPPDGSKEGWSTSDMSDTVRAEYIAWLRQQCHDDSTH